ncbi:MAG: hypothetical protein HQ500_08295 [Flavobacteriales bacterium]|nr:hypothetical protein [Flavobacteriales bacterium]
MKDSHQGSEVAMVLRSGSSGSHANIHGLGLIWNEFLQLDKFHVSARLDLWDQDLFDKGLSGEAWTDIKISDGVNLAVGLQLYTAIELQWV